MTKINNTSCVHNFLKVVHLWIKDLFLLVQETEICDVQVQQNYVVTTICKTIYNITNGTTRPFVPMLRWFVCAVQKMNILTC